jgi:hypothetical protein
LVSDHLTNAWKPFDRYARDPDLINTVPAQAISVVKDKDGRELDAVEVVTRYLASLPHRTTAPKTGRLKLIKPIPAASFGNSTTARRHAIDNTIARHDTGDMATRAAGKANLRRVYWAYAGPPHCPAG